ncbi:MAG: GNAT family N-acetyltransferase [Thermotaleaceae bacterium]
MEIRELDRASIEAYLEFCKGIYKDNPYYRDSMSSVLRDILKGKAQICKSSMLVPVMAIEGEKILAVCIFAIVDRMGDTLQMAYFEALPHQEKAVEALIHHGKKLAKHQGIHQILIGLNLHVNYGLGLLASEFNQRPSFGTAYNPPYYIDYLQSMANEEIGLVSYLAKMENFDFGMKDRWIEKMTAKYNVRKADFKKLKRDAAIYTDLNNRAFKKHRFYYARKEAEDLELFSEFKLLLREENLLFLEHEGEPIGFMLWYPDYNELIKPGETLGLKTLIKNRIYGHRIQRFKIVELGVLPEFQKKGAVFTLFYKLRQMLGERYKECESGWILEDNLSSRGLCYRWAEREYKQYKVFLLYL